MQPQPQRSLRSAADCSFYEYFFSIIWPSSSIYSGMSEAKLHRDHTADNSNSYVPLRVNTVHSQLKNKQLNAESAVWCHWWHSGGQLSIAALSSNHEWSPCLVVTAHTDHTICVQLCCMAVSHADHWTTHHAGIVLPRARTWLSNTVTCTCLSRY